jgi:cytoskeletal protein CcmA (bactofilin family)
MWFCVLFLLTTTVFLIPLIPALHEWYTKTDIDPLKIIQSHEGDIRYFARTFRTFIESEIEALIAKRGTVRSPDSYRMIAADAVFTPSKKEYQRRITQQTLIVFGKLELPNGFVFMREIYGQQAVVGGSSNRFHCVLAEDNLFIGANSFVSRWAHARTIEVAPGCRILGQLSADEDIILQPGCFFTRVHAPCVKFGYAEFPFPADEVNVSRSFAQQQAIFRLLEYNTDAAGRCVIDGDLEFSDKCIWHGDLVVRGNLLIHPEVKIVGNIKAYGTLRVRNNVTINGSLVTDGSLVIARGCAIGGPVVAERQVDIDAGTTIGTAEKPTTVTASIIRVASGAAVHGTLWAREQGTSLPALQFELNFDKPH